ncbi:hypothetical protein ACFCX0_30945 [Streptomyces sp. NPDC056352]|uniref:hypothetical protein n=1 Tax=Streptomyces sp. NPDC056352 TaxID=3345791 RepID=UPI0035D58383
MAIELSVELMELERAAWAEQQENRLTVETAEVLTSNTERAHALAPWLTFYNTRRRQTALAGQSPISRLSPKS